MLAKSRDNLAVIRFDVNESQINDGNIITTTSLEKNNAFCDRIWHTHITICNNIALPYFIFWYLPEISTFLKIRDGYVIAPHYKHLNTLLKIQVPRSKQWISVNMHIDLLKINFRLIVVVSKPYIYQSINWQNKVQMP